MKENNLEKIAITLSKPPKGILAADESTNTITKRFDGVNVDSSFENRRKYRELLFKTPDLNKFISGVILYDETIRQSTSEGIPFSEFLKNLGILVGIKVDTGAFPLTLNSNEKITEGLDGLRDRLKIYYKLGARFTKWRGVYIISDKYPSKLAVHSNAHALARYAALVQESGMVPIVEPEVLIDGDHNSEDCFKKTSEVLKKCYDELILNKVDLKGTILKPNMILPGVDCKEKIECKKIAELTLKCLEESVPSEVPGIAFLSGGQTEKEAVKNLNEINKLNKSNFIITYSYGRALQQSALKFWSKDIKNISGTQNTFNHRAKMCSLAAQGKWTAEIENK